MERLRQHRLFLMKCKVVKHKGAPTICNKTPQEKNVKLKILTHRLSLYKGVGNLNLDKELCWNQ